MLFDKVGWLTNPAKFFELFFILVLLCQVHGQGDLWVKLPSYGNNNHLVIHSNLCITALSCMSLDKATSR